MALQYENADEFLCELGGYGPTVRVFGWGVAIQHTDASTTTEIRIDQTALVNLRARLEEATATIDSAGADEGRTIADLTAEEIERHKAGRARIKLTPMGDES